MGGALATDAQNRACGAIHISESVEHQEYALERV